MIDYACALARLSVFVLTLLCGYASAQSASPSGSFGFLLNAWNQNPAATGAAFLGVMNFDGAGNVTGTYTFRMGGNNVAAVQTATGSLTGTYTTNAASSGSITMTVDLGATFTLAMVTIDGGQGLQLAVTSCPACNLKGTEFSGYARAAYSGPLNGSYGFQLAASPNPSALIGVITFDGAGNSSMSSTIAGAGGPNGQFFENTASLPNGSYTLNSDGTGTISFGPAGSPSQTIAIVSTDGGSGLLMLATAGTLGTPSTIPAGNEVFFGSARLQ